jgi:hypothetical protein
MMRSKSTKVIANVVVGPPDVEPSAPSHIRGIFQGNSPHAMQRPKGQRNEHDGWAEGTDRRSTGIRPSAHTTIDPRMPKLSPA